MSDVTDPPHLQAKKQFLALLQSQRAKVSRWKTASTRTLAALAAERREAIERLLSERRELLSVNAIGRTLRGARSRRQATAALMRIETSTPGITAPSFAA